MTIASKITPWIAAACLLAQTSTAFAQTAGEEPNFLEQLAGAVENGVKQGVDNGTRLSTSNLRVLGYTMQHSRLYDKPMPAYCLADAADGKLLTTAPMFGTPFRNADGTIGFRQNEKPTHDNGRKFEVNLNGTLPGLNCRDLIANNQLLGVQQPAVATSGGALPWRQQPAAPAPQTVQECAIPTVNIPNTGRTLCAANMNDGAGSGILDNNTGTFTAFKRGQCSDENGKVIALGKRCITILTSFRTDGLPPTQTYYGRGVSTPLGKAQ